MSVSAYGQFRVQASVVFAQVGEESVLLNTESGRYFGLDPLGTRVWISLSNGAMEEQICAELLEEYAVESEVLRTDLRRILEQLEQRGLITAVSILA